MIYRNDHYGPIDRFCAKHPRFGISNLAMYVAIGQAAVGIMELIVELVLKRSLVTSLMFNSPLILRGRCGG